MTYPKLSIAKNEIEKSDTSDIFIGDPQSVARLPNLAKVSFAGLDACEGIANAAQQEALILVSQGMSQEGQKVIMGTSLPSQKLLEEFARNDEI